MDSLLVGGELLLYGSVGDPWGDGSGFTPRDVALALAEHGSNPLTVRINSGGGVAADGMAIHSLLAAHRAPITMIADGIAASAASLIFMVGSKRIMRAGAMLMIHDVSGWTLGNADAHRRSADVLDRLSDNYARIYAAASGLDADEVRNLMRVETWMTSEQAVEKGFATALDADPATEAAAFDYSLYAHAPQGLLGRSTPKGSTMTTKPKAWTADFFAAAEKSGLPISALNAIVAKADTLEAAQAALIDAQAKAAADQKHVPKAAPDDEADAGGKAWAAAFYASAEKSGLPVADLNKIVAKADGLAAAQTALIDAMAAANRARVPQPNISAGYDGTKSGSDKTKARAKLDRTKIFARVKGGSDKARPVNED